MQFVRLSDNSWSYTLPLACKNNSITSTITCNPGVTLTDFNSATCADKWSVSVTSTCGTFAVEGNDGVCTNDSPPFWPFTVASLVGCPDENTCCRTCCKEIDETTASCEIDPLNLECDPCAGVCVDIATGEETCKTKAECCGDTGIKCVTNCATSPQTNSWSACAATDCLTCTTSFPASYFKQVRDGCSCGSQCNRTTRRTIGKSFSGYFFSTAQLRWNPCYPGLLDATGKQWAIVAEEQYYDQYQDSFFNAPPSAYCDSKWYQCSKYKLKVKVLVCDRDQIKDVTSEVLQNTQRVIQDYTANNGKIPLIYTVPGTHYDYTYCRMRSGGGAGNEAGPFNFTVYSSGDCDGCSTTDFLQFPAGFMATPMPRLEIDFNNAR